MLTTSRPPPLLDLSVSEKSFDHRCILQDVRFSVRPGEVVSLVGPSGCGKSTLLRIVAGLDRAYRGAVRIHDAPPQLHSRHVGMIFQEPRLMPWLTVAQNIGFEVGPAAARHTRVRTLLDQVGLTGFGEAWPKALSGGMAQRAAIARGLFSQPDLLLLDEPFSAVDAITRIRLQDLLLTLAQRNGTTLLLVTHDVNEAVYLSDRVLVFGTQPGTLLGEVPIHLPHPRDRRHRLLVQREAEVLALLTGHPENVRERTDAILHAAHLDRGEAPTLWRNLPHEPVDQPGPHGFADCRRSDPDGAAPA